MHALVSSVTFWSPGAMETFVQDWTERVLGGVKHPNLPHALRSPSFSLSPFLPALEDREGPASPLILDHTTPDADIIHHGYCQASCDSSYLRLRCIWHDPLNQRCPSRHEGIRRQCPWWRCTVRGYASTRDPDAGVPVWCQSHSKRPLLI